MTEYINASLIPVLQAFYRRERGAAEEAYFIRAVEERRIVPVDDDGKPVNNKLEVTTNDD